MSPSMVIAAGGIVVRVRAHGPELVLIHRPKYDDWSLPKGKVDPGEGIADAALREVEEETALRCELGDYVGTIVYTDETDSPKRTHYWLMSVVGERDFVPNREIDGRRWVSIDDATALLRRAEDRSLLDVITPAVALP
ncbi:NUDIX hydrolase [Ruania alkalisoli]|uniref:NUDIX hydrolase n=1 Tax=Ruania alkalisoli TaxID=2779775 RepID=A0A7M1T0I0_9MICO|nr:NUDIX hydrolase [Ruania alkalisoli]QOR72393.1 NUDIX hydrolase [Ruania alkalisoli]